MAKKGRGLHSYTVQEAQNATMGQAGALLTNDTSNDIDAPSNQVFVALQMVEDVTFTTLTQEDNKWFLKIYINPLVSFIWIGIVTVSYTHLTLPTTPYV